MSDITAPYEEFAAFFRFGYGETLSSFWLVKGHVLVRLVKARQAQEPGPIVTAEAVDHEGPIVWLGFHDVEALRRYAAYLVEAADRLESKEFVNEIEHPEGT